MSEWSPSGQKLLFVLRKQCEDGKGGMVFTEEQKMERRDEKKEEGCSRGRNKALTKDLP